MIICGLWLCIEYYNWWAFFIHNTRFDLELIFMYNWELLFYWPLCIHSFYVFTDNNNLSWKCRDEYDKQLHKTHARPLFCQSKPTHTQDSLSLQYYACEFVMKNLECETRKLSNWPPARMRWRTESVKFLSGWERLFLHWSVPLFICLMFLFKK